MSLRDDAFHSYPPSKFKRRQLQLLGLGIDVKLADLVHEIAMRDERDEKRKISPLKPADDVILIDTTELSIMGVFDQVWHHVQGDK